MSVKNSTLKWILAAAAVVVLAVGIFLIARNPAAKTVGTVQITVQDQNGKTLADKKIGYKEGDTLVSLLENNFKNVRLKDGMLMDIESLVTPDDWSYYIAFYKDGKYSEVGVGSAVLEPDARYSFVFEKLEY